MAEAYALHSLAQYFSSFADEARERERVRERERERERKREQDIYKEVREEGMRFKDDNRLANK